MTWFSEQKHATEYFKSISVEQCEVCGGWSALEADHDEGNIIGPYCINGDAIYNRICRGCSESELCPKCLHAMELSLVSDDDIYVLKCDQCGHEEKTK